MSEKTWPKIKRLSWVALMAFVFGLPAVLWIHSAFHGFQSISFASAHWIRGGDYIRYYVTAKMLISGHTSDLFSEVLMEKFQYQIFDALELFGFPQVHNPPLFILFFVPFAYLPYPLSAALWMTFGMALYFLSFRVLGVGHWLKTGLFFFLWVPVFLNLNFGQNAFLSLFILVLVYNGWKKDHHVLAGLLSGMLFYKPHLLSGVILLWLFQWRKNWKCLLGLAISAGVVIAGHFILLPDATRDYLEFVPKFVSEEIAYNNYYYHLCFSMLMLINLIIKSKIGVLIAKTIYDAVVLIGFFQYLRTFKDHRDLQFAGAITVTTLLAPYLQIYDLTLLVIPAVILLEKFGFLRTKNLFLLFGIVPLFAGSFWYSRNVLHLGPLFLFLSSAVLQPFLKSELAKNE